MTVTLEEARKSLDGLIDKVSAGESVVITRGEKPVAVLSSPPSSVVVPEFGCCKGMLTINSEDDEHLKDFADYMP